MKTTMFKSALLLTCLSLFAVGCGKDGGGGNSSRNSFSNTSNLSDTSKNFLQKITNWYNATEKRTLKNYVKSHVVSSQQNTGNNASSCAAAGGTLKKYWIFEFCLINGSNTTGGTTNPVTSTGYRVGLNSNSNPDYNKPIYCEAQIVQNYNGTYLDQCPNAPVAYAGKASNTKLQEAFGKGASASLTLANVVAHQSLSGVYHLIYTSNSLNSQASVIYTIDTNIHTMYNPVEVIDLRSGQVDQTVVQLLN